MKSKHNRITQAVLTALLMTLVIGWNAHAATYDVTKDPFYAVGDGVSNCTAAINSALATAYNDGGGTVYLPAGTYVVDRLDVGSNTIIVGDRAGATVLKRATGSDQPMLVADAAGGIPGSSNITVRAIAFNANKAQTTGTPNCVTFDGTEDFLVVDCVLYDSTSHTLSCSGTSNGTIRNCEFYDGTASSVYMIACDNMHVAGCFSRTSGAHGYELKNCGNVKFSAAHATKNSQSGFYMDSCDSVLLEGCLAQSNTSNGFQVYSTDLLNQNIFFNGCIARLNDTGFSITDTQYFDLAGCMANENGTGMVLVDNVNKCSDFSLTGCHMVDNQKEGVTLDGASVGEIEGCLISNNSQSQTNAYDGIYMIASSDLRIAGCSLIDSQPVPTQRRAITTTGGSDAMTVIYNDVAGNSSTPAIQLEGTNNTARLNITL